MAGTNGGTNGAGLARDGSRRGGRRAGAGRRVGSRNKRTLKREAKLAKAVDRGIEPVEFLLSEMRDTSLPREQRWLLAKWVAPYLAPRLASVAIVKSIRAMTDEELDWAIADARQGQPSAGFYPRVIRGGR